MLRRQCAVAGPSRWQLAQQRRAVNSAESRGVDVECDGAFVDRCHGTRHGSGSCSALHACASAGGARRRQLCASASRASPWWSRALVCARARLARGVWIMTVRPTPRRLCARKSAGCCMRSPLFVCSSTVRQPPRRQSTARRPRRTAVDRAVAALPVAACAPPLGRPAASDVAAGRFVLSGVLVLCAWRAAFAPCSWGSAAGLSWCGLVCVLGG